MTKPLNSQALAEKLQDLVGWETAENKIVREFQFENFRESMGFLVRVGFEAEVMDHHPEIYNVYNKVRLELTTHDAGNQVTDKDLKLAAAINKLVAS